MTISEMSKSKIEQPSAKLTQLKEMLDKMMNAIQDELLQVDMEWAQLCSIALQQSDASTSPSENADVVLEDLVDSRTLDDPGVVNEIDLEL